ncbi:MAG TPA: ribosome-associated translation inhibitor RaiA [Pseudonocardia sp.]|jgi:ribosomal subunit interface protein
MTSTDSSNAGHFTADGKTGAEMAIAITGRNVEVSAGFQAHVADKMARLEKYTDRVIRYDVELYHERNPRQSRISHRIEITGKGDGPTVRAESSGPDFYTALDLAVTKLDARLRRGHGRLRVHHGRHTLISVAAATAPLAAAQLIDAADARPAPASPDRT